MEAIHAAFYMVSLVEFMMFHFLVISSINDIIIAVLGSTINYGSELPLAQGINFG